MAAFCTIPAGGKRRKKNVPNGVTGGQPGGICISGAVYDQVRNKVELSFDDLGERSLKNISYPVRVFGMRGAAEAGPLPERAAATPPTRPSALPSIAVLPFANLGGDPEHDYFADGITEDLITELSRFQELRVIARNSVLTYKTKPVRVQEVGRDLGVRYVLEGSVRKVGGRVRITAQLVDAATGHHLWAERFDRDLAEIFEVQDEVTGRIVATLAGKLAESERRRARSGQTENLEAYDCVLRGREHWDRFTPEDNREARRLYEKAIEARPRLRSRLRQPRLDLPGGAQRAMGGRRGPAARAGPRVRAAGCHGQPGIPLEPSRFGPGLPQQGPAPLVLLLLWLN
jgi:adenylate cyclase